MLLGRGEGACERARRISPYPRSGRSPFPDRELPTARPARTSSAQLLHPESLMRFEGVEATGPGVPSPAGPARALTVAGDLQSRVVAAAAFLEFEVAVRGRLAGGSLHVEMRLLRRRLGLRLRRRLRRLRGGWLGLELVKGAPRPGATLQGCRQVLLPRAVASPALGVPESLPFGGGGGQESSAELIAAGIRPER